MYDQHDAYENTSPSRSEKKREMLKLQALGQRLTELPASRLQGLALPQDLHDAVLEYQRVASREARRRQLQYIGRLMREVDAAPIEAALAENGAMSRADAQRFQALEATRDALLSGDEDMVARVREALAPGRRREFQTLLDTARRERAASGRPHAFRALFRFLREHLDT